MVHRRGDVVIRDAGPWTPAVHALLRHLEDTGFAAAPRLVGSGLDPGATRSVRYTGAITSWLVGRGRKSR